MKTAFDDRSAGLKNPSSKSSRKSARRIWLSLHMFLGLFAGAVFVIIGITGSTLVFRRTLDAWLNPNLLIARETGAPVSLETALSNIKRAAPSGTHIERVDLPQNMGEVIRVLYRPPSQSRTSLYDTEVLIHPTNGSILGQRERDNHLMGILFHFHREILAGKNGETIIGTFGIILLISLTSGIYLWWPRRGGVSTSFIPRLRASPLQRVYAQHKIAGVVGCVPVFLIAFSGIFMEFEDLGRALVNRVSPLFPNPQIASDQDSGSSLVSADEAIILAQRHFPASFPIYLEMPNGPVGTYVVGMRQRGEPLKTGGATAVWIDQYSGKILAFRDWETFSAGQTFVTWMLPLHNGEAFELPGRIVAFTAGFVPLTLYVTALRMWRLKRQAHRRQRGESS